MKSLSNILPENLPTELFGAKEKAIHGMSLDSRKVEEGFLFAALKGSQADGHRFIDKAIANGATAILCEELPAKYPADVSFIKVQNAALALGHMASAFYGNPSYKMDLVGITGTNGKTSTATVLKNAVEALDIKAGLISTVQVEIGEKIIPTTHTTPNAIAINAHLAKMLDEGCSHVFMEVSSHALDQERTAGLLFRGGIFTNLSHDHLDYHKTFSNYLKAKKKLFDGLNHKAFALSNKDDKNGEIMLQNTSASKHYYSLKNMSDYKAKVLEQDFTSMLIQINEHEVYTRLTGTFNAYNITAAYATMEQLGFEIQDILVGLSQAQGAEGRLEWIKNDDNVVGIVDFAHTPDALDNVLKSIKEINEGSRIFTVIGCGGNRDASKRPQMARLASEHSYQVILTSDNPRNENPESIIAQMEEGIPLHKRMNTLSISDRKNAIKTACQLAQSGDLILVAGKGHEKYQEINGVKHPFDDKAILKDYLLSAKT